MDNICFAFIGIHLLFPFFKFSTAVDAITQAQFISDGRSLTSKDGNFELGFFSPANSSSRFLGIWNRKIPLRTVSWIANVHKPINDSSGILMINGSGNAVLLSQNTPVLLNSGNLVLRDWTDGNSGIFLRQSFDYPIGTMGLSARRVSLSASEDVCDNYGHRGAYGVCTISELQVCKCLKGFKPVSPEKWKERDYTQGCERSKPLKCQKNTGFIKYVGLKLPENKNGWVSQGMNMKECEAKCLSNMKECEAKCLSNCSCMAYATSDAEGSSACVVWFGKLINIRRLLNGGQHLYVRMPDSELGTDRVFRLLLLSVLNSSSVWPMLLCHLDFNHEEIKNGVKIVVTIVAVVSIVSGLLLAAYYIRRNWKMSKEIMDIYGATGQNNNGREEDLELPLSKLSTIASAINNFSFNNKLGQGGFGPEYRGALMDGQEIAVKRLSPNSGQGPNEFKNEVILVAKLQHRNLMRNFPDHAQGKLLDWRKWFNLILGVARGLLYLHEDSRLRIIHRDLKAGNVLLDKEMNPKISDFGMARTFGGDQTEGVTRRVVGTFGYMAPEYAIGGQFSVKSDVFSFGILMLEIVSGKKNRGFYHLGDNLNLVGYAWKLWEEERSQELIDECFRDSCTLLEVLRCIHVSLLCVQQLPEDRPSMSTLILMLGDEKTLPRQL
ncbi:G-type lectin S-receptor-like serine/threonine-protein kinase SD1-13 [Ziziphus jujuba]|uniref:G-type lectin S-receptor-like serine/threonine-protein kinase SD1-13 n=1 Tax=Ziziphus jujuba TaxID=326968 RepID=A0ABM3ZZM8_ZIZJJ|nr:G-type lectin S-receptor-like serine/threonine-protein kinase SD1-13 [Ziziphus jujuba]